MIGYKDNKAMPKDDARDGGSWNMAGKKFCRAGDDLRDFAWLRIFIPGQWNKKTGKPIDDKDNHNTWKGNNAIFNALESSGIKLKVERKIYMNEGENLPINDVDD